MRLVNIESIIGSAVVDADGTEVGEIASAYASPRGWSVDELQILLSRDYAGQLGLRGTWLKDVYVLVEAECVEWKDEMGRISMKVDQFQTYLDERQD